MPIRYTNIARSHYLPLFFQPWWLQATCSHWEYSLIEEKGELIAIWPYQIEKKLHLKLIRNPLLTPYLGPYFFETNALTAEEKEKYIDQLYQQIPAVNFFQFEALPKTESLEFLKKKGFQISPHQTHYIFLDQNEEQLFSQIQNRRKSYIRKAMQRLTIEKCDQPDWELFQKWHQHAFQQKGVKYPFSSQFFDKIFKVAEEKQSSLFLTAKDEEGKVIAMLWTPFDQQITYHLLSAFDPARPFNGAVDALVWTAILAAKERGNAIYDFEGSMDKGIASFFRKLGGQPLPYYSFQKNNSIIWKIKRQFLG